MTNNMEKMRFEVARAIITYFPKNYIEMVLSEVCQRKNL